MGRGIQATQTGIMISKALLDLRVLNYFDSNRLHVVSRPEITSTSPAIWIAVLDRQNVVGDE